MNKRVLSQIAVWILRCLSYLPLGILYFLAHILYFLVYHIIAYRKQIVRSNIQNSFPEKSEQECLTIEIQFYRHFANLIVEVIKFPSLGSKNLSKRVHFKNPEVFEKYLQAEQNFIACSGHIGNWEWATAAFALKINQHDFKTFNVYKKLNNSSFENYMKNTRNIFGGEAVEMKQILRTMITHKSEKFCVVLAADQSPAAQDLNYFTTFLNQRTPIYLGVEKLAKSFQLPIIFFNTYRTQKGYYEVICEEITAQPERTANYEITEKHVRSLEQVLQKNPYNWLWSHKRWKHSNAKQMSTHS